MFQPVAPIQKLTAEVLVAIASLLTLKDVLEFSCTAKTFRHLNKDELLFRKLSHRDFDITEKPVETTWFVLYQQHYPKKESVMTHVDMAEHVIATVPVTTESNEPVTTESNEPVTTESNEPVTTESNEPVTTESNEPVTTESNEPNPTKANEPVTTKANEPVTTEPNEPNPTEPNEPNPTKVIEPNPTVDWMTTDEPSLDCPHMPDLTETFCELKRIIFKSEFKSICDICKINPSSHLNMSPDTYSEGCISCLNQKVKDDYHYPVQIEFETGKVYCFECKGKPKDRQEMEWIRDRCSEREDENRRKAEHALYIQELRREDMSLMYYLLEKQWGRTWMLYRTREGSPLPTKITNNKLARLNGTLDPNIRLPMDKYRPSPETHGDIISEKLWLYLSKAYGVQGKAYNEDDILAPEYARLRVYVDDFKKSIHLYP